jgi:hypothetical protein
MAGHHTEAVNECFFRPVWAVWLWNKRCLFYQRSCVMLLVHFASFSIKIDVSEKSTGVLYACFAVQKLDLTAMNDIISCKSLICFTVVSNSGQESF